MYMYIYIYTLTNLITHKRTRLRPEHTGTHGRCRRAASQKLVLSTDITDN